MKHVKNLRKRNHFFQIKIAQDRKSTRLNSSHVSISYAVFCLKKKTTSTSAVSSNPNFVTRQKTEIIFGYIQNARRLKELNQDESGLRSYVLFSHLNH